MNWVLIMVLLILAVSAIIGYSKGLLRIAYSLAAWVIVLMFVAWATPHINRFLTENTMMDEKLTVYCEETMRDLSEEQMQETQSEKEAELAGLSVQLPGSALEVILQKTEDAAGELLEESGAYSKVAEGMAGFLMNGISFLIALVTIWVLVQLLSQIIGIASKIPVIKGVNRFLGLFAGGLYGLTIVWLGFYMAALGSTGQIGSAIVSYIYESPFLTYLYENNLVLTLILKYF